MTVRTPRWEASIENMPICSASLRAVRQSDEELSRTEFQVVLNWLEELERLVPPANQATTR